MLTTEEQYVISLIRAGLIGGECNEPKGLNRAETARIIINGGVLLTVYPKLSNAMKTILEPSYFSAIHQFVNQDYSGNIILKALSDAGLSCIPLKGWELRKLYPAPSMRQMADLDILVKPYDYVKIKSIMEKLGFSSHSESDWMHDNFQLKSVNVEMHKRLTDDSGAIQNWENGMWERALSLDGNLYCMSPEDFSVFHFVHLFKDFTNGSLGLRRIVDTWFLQHQVVDMAKVQSLMDSFGIGLFFNRMLRLGAVVMGEEPMDEKSEVLLKYAFNSGIYGTAKSYKVGRIASMGKNAKIGKLKSALAAILLPYKRMKAFYPILKKFPILLPLFWVKRIFRILSGNVNKYLNMLDYRDVSEADCIEVRRVFQAGGVEK